MLFAIRRIPGGQAGTDATVRQIGRFVESSLHRPNIRLLAIQILDRANASSHQPLKAASALHSWMRQRIAYVRDPISVETVQDPEATAKIHAGDCDDHTGLMAALAASIGLPVRYVVLGITPDDCRHIFCEVQIDGRWMPADTTTSMPFGKMISMPFRKIYSISGVSNMKALSQAVKVLPTVSRRNVQAAAYRAAFAQLKNNWNRGLINVDDLTGYLRLIDRGDSPGRGTVVERPMRAAIQAFRDMVVGSGAVSGKPEGTLSGIGDVGGLFNSVWGAVKDAVAKTTFELKVPQVVIPEGLIRTTVPPVSAVAAAKGAVETALKSPVVLVVIGAIVFMILKK